MQIKISPDDIETIISEADSAARRLRRRLGLPACDREDLGQDLLIDLLRRLPAFDPDRGSLGAFAGLILRNQSSRISIRIMRERRAQGGGLLSLDAPSDGDDQRPLAEIIGQDEGLSAWHGLGVGIDVAALVPVPLAPVLRVRKAAAEVQWEGRSVILSRQIFPVFERLLEKALSRDQVASQSHVEGTTAREAKDLIRELRDAFKAAGFSDAESKALIATVRGRGYRLGVVAGDIVVEG